MIPREALRERIARTIPLWGSGPFPYRCGVTEAEYVAWAVSPEQKTFKDQSLQAETVGGMLASFCGDCGERNAAINAGTCIKPELDAYIAHSRAAIPLALDQASARLASEVSPASSTARALSVAL